MLLVQKFLETKTFEDLIRDHGVYPSFSKSGHKWSLNYDMIESKELDLLAQECRGLVLSAEDGKSFLSQAVMINGRLSYNHICPGKTKIISFGFKRFFNYGRGSAANINWSDPTLKVMDKMDGTLILASKDPFTNQWCAGTRSSPEADIVMDNGIFTFRTLFEKAIQDTCGYDFNHLTSMMDPNYTYCFELCSRYNRIVVDYPENKIALLMVRDLTTLNEVDFTHPVVEKLVGVPRVDVYTYTSVSELVDWISTLSPSEHEGVVVLDSNSNRIKIKSAAYVAASKLRDSLGCSERNCMEIILQEKDDDVASFLPEEIVNNLIKIKSGVQKLIKLYDEVYIDVKKRADETLINDKKTFALLVNQHKELWSAPLFQMFDGKVFNMKDFILKSRKDGSWSSSFLDKLLEMSKNC